MDEKQLIFETEKIIEAAFILLEDYDDKEARRLVKKTIFLNELVNRLLMEAQTSKAISNIADNSKTKVTFARYVNNLTTIANMFSNYSEYNPKTKVGYYMYIKDIATYANEFKVEK